MRGQGVVFGGIWPHSYSKDAPWALVSAALFFNFCTVKVQGHLDVVECISVSRVKKNKFGASWNLSSSVTIKFGNL